MSDPTSPDFTVVDRRATTEKAEPETEAAASPEQNAPSENVSEEANGDMPGMPDPAFLVSFGGMQMEPRILAKTLLAIFDQQAWVAMGLVASPQTGQPTTDLPAAQLAIDCVQFLLGKVENDLAEEERRDARRRLNDLRMNYLAKQSEKNETAG